MRESAGSSNSRRVAGRRNGSARRIFLQEILYFSGLKKI
jgi:hypothetical protein